MGLCVDARYFGRLAAFFGLEWAASANFAPSVFQSYLAARWLGLIGEFDLDLYAQLSINY